MLARRREHLRTNAPGRSRSQRAPKRNYPRNVRAPAGTQVNQEQARCNDDREGNNQSSESRHPVHGKHNDLRQPLVVDPGLTEAGERIRIRVEEGVILEHQLAGAKVPPCVGIGHSAGGHGKQAKREDGNEDPASCKNLDHCSFESTLVGTGQLNS
jgi:hypothetical protein